MLDLRVPIGVLFLAVGLLLLTVAGERARIDAGPVNFYSALVMLAFGAVMLLLGRRAATRR